MGDEHIQWSVREMSSSNFRGNIGSHASYNGRFQYHFQNGRRWNNSGRTLQNPQFQPINREKTLPRSQYRGRENRGGLNNQWESGKTTTLFVDNLPSDIRKGWVFNLFSRFGRVSDLFIPNKISRNTGQKFGFVIFARKEVASLVCSKINGSRIWGQKLIVKEPRFGRNSKSSNNTQGITNKRCTQGIRNKRRISETSTPDPWLEPHRIVRKKVWRKKKKKQIQVWRPKMDAKKIVEVGKNHGRSYLDALRGNKNYKIAEVGKNHGISYLDALRGNKNYRATQPMKLMEFRNEWLYRSVIAKLSPVRSMALIQDQLRSLGYADVQVRVMGGNFVVLTFICWNLINGKSSP